MATLAAASKQLGWGAGDSGNYVPEDKEQPCVQTPYGRGIVLRVRKGQPQQADNDDQARKVYDIELTEWSQRSGENNSNTSSGGPKRPAMLFSSVQYPSVAPTVGCDVRTPFGRGRVTEIRSSKDHDSEVVVVQLSSWRLAGRSKVTCYLSMSSLSSSSKSDRNLLQVVRSKRLYEMTVFEKVEKAMEIKAAAARAFSQKDYETALQSYRYAMDAVKYVQHASDSTNHVRADLLVVLITSLNNAATCAAHLDHQWDAVLRWTQEAISLLNALHEKRGMKIHAILLQDGYTDLKVFGEWRAKAYLLMARAHAHKHNFEEAMDTCKKAHALIAQYATTTTTSTTTTTTAANGGAYETEQQQQPQKPQLLKPLLSVDREIQKLHTACKERRKLQIKKEKQRAVAMFGGSGGSSSTTTGTTERAAAAAASARNENEAQSRALTTESSPTATTRRAAALAGADDSNNDRNHHDDTKKEVPWYQDTEVLVGLGIVAGAASATMLILHFFVLSSSTKRK